MQDNEKSTVYESDCSLITVHCIDGEYFYTFAESDLMGPYVEEREAYQEAMREIASVLQGALDALGKIEKHVQEMREPFQDLRRITEA